MTLQISCLARTRNASLSARPLPPPRPRPVAPRCPRCFPTSHHQQHRRPASPALFVRSSVHVSAAKARVHLGGKRSGEKKLYVRIYLYIYIYVHIKEGGKERSTSPDELVHRTPVHRSTANNFPRCKICGVSLPPQPSLPAWKSHYFSTVE